MGIICEFSPRFPRARPPGGEAQLASGQTEPNETKKREKNAVKKQKWNLLV